MPYIQISIPVLTSLLEIGPEEISRFNDTEQAHDIKAAKLFLLTIIPEIICFGYSAYFCIFKRACRPGWKQFLSLLLPGLSCICWTQLNFEPFSVDFFVHVDFNNAIV